MAKTRLGNPLMPLEIHVLSNIKNAVGPRQMMIMPGMVNPGERVALVGLRLLVVDP